MQALSLAIIAAKGAVSPIRPTRSRPDHPAVPMSTAALVMVLAAAVLKASWNAIVRAAADDRALTMVVVAFAHALVGAIAIFFTRTPAPAAWPFLFGSSLAHYSYFRF